MASKKLIAWLRIKRRKAFVSSSLYSVVALTGGAILLLLTSWPIFLAAKLVLLLLYPTSYFVNGWTLIATALIMALLFADGIRSVRDDMSILPLWFLRETFEITPRVILDGIRRANRARRLAQMDIALTADLLAYLAAKSHPTTRVELAKVFPELSWSMIADQLRLLDGVIFFSNDAGRLTLTMPLRLELRPFLAANTTEPAQAKPQPAPVIEPSKLSPRDILGVGDDASLAEIKLAYRSRVKECHPDRFAGLDDHSRELAEEWTKALNAAYATLTARSRAAN